MICHKDGGMCKQHNDTSNKFCKYSLNHHWGRCVLDVGVVDEYNHISSFTRTRGGAVWQLVGLITRRS